MEPTVQLVGARLTVDTVHVSYFSTVAFADNLMHCYICLFVYLIFI